jgi:CRISPR system Cascade subunit CasB
MRLESIVDTLSRGLLALDTGSLADLRKMSVDGPGPHAYWKLAAECDVIDQPFLRWAPLVRAMALMTPKGQRQLSDRVHDHERKLGAALCDGGAAAWPNGSPSPLLSEQRLGRLLAAPGARRSEMLTRAVAMVAVNRDRSRGLDCVGLASLMLGKDVKRDAEDVARAYYRRLDGANRAANTKEQTR